jgi:hypothetical protein
MRHACMENLLCNICGEVIDMAEVSQHVSGRNHAVKKKVAEFNEMNAQVGRNRYENDTSVVNAWIRSLYSYDFLSSGKT